jgi:DNA polymerase I
MGIKEVKDKLKLDLSVEVRYNLCVLPKAAKAYFGVQEDGTVDIKGLTAIKSNSPKYIQNVFKNCVNRLKNVKNQVDFLKAKNKIKQVVKQAVKDLKSGKIPISDLEYAVEIHEDPKKKIKSKTLHQPYQAAIQLIDIGRSVKRWDVVHFIKVKPFNYSGKNYTVKPTSLVKNLREINLEDYIRNLKTALNQTFKPMDITFSDEKLKERTLLDFA